MKQFKAFMVAALAVCLTGCSGGSTSAASSGTETKAEFAPDQVSVVYAEEEYEGRTITTAKITNNSNERFSNFVLQYRAADGFAKDDVFHQIFGEDKQFTDYASLSLLVMEVLEPGESSHAYRLTARIPGSPEKAYMTPELMKLVSPDYMTVRFPQDDSTMIEREFHFIGGDLSNVGEKISYTMEDRWNSWDDAGIQWLQQISGHDYTVYAYRSKIPGSDEDGTAEYSDGMSVNVYDADEAFVQSYLEMIRSNCPDLQPVRDMWGDETTMNGIPVTVYYLSDDAFTKEVSINWLKEIGTMSFTASSLMENSGSQDLQ